MVKDGKGGAKTLTGLNFEEKVDFIDLLKKINGYKVVKSILKPGLNVIYKDVLDYINSVNCYYKFNELPLAWLGLPTGKTK